MIKLKNLKGLSGCLIELMEDANGKNYVKKTSASLAYNNRLELQVEKQRSFKNDHIKAPAIFDTGYDEKGLFFCLMEYVHGVNFTEYLNLYSFKDSLDLFYTLLNSISGTLNAPESNDSAQKVSAKISELSAKNIGHDGLLAYLQNNIPQHIPCAGTHGDFTFENILVSHDKQLYFIDFLDSFIDSPYIDLSKINQELSLFWSIRHSEHSNSMLIKYERLAKIFHAYCSSNKIDNPLLVFFSILTLLRILPYTNNQMEIELINKNIKKWEKELL